MSKISILFFVLGLLLWTISAASADCYKDGKAYKTGTKIDGFICTPDGRWVKDN